MEFELQQSPAIKALGSLFKFTQSRLWDETSAWSRGESESREDDLMRRPLQTVDAGLSTTTMSSEDVELAAQMDALGLPLSFSTNKRNNMIRGKRKDTNKNYLHIDVEIKDAVRSSITVREHEISSPKIIHDKISGLLCCMSKNESSMDVKFLSSEMEDLATLTKRVVSAAVIEDRGSKKTSEELRYCQSCGSISNQNLSKNDFVMESSSISLANGNFSSSFLIKNDGSGQSEKNQESGLTEPPYFEVSEGNCTGFGKSISNIWTELSEDLKSRDAGDPQFSQALGNDTIHSDCISEDNQSKECEKLLNEICDRISLGPDSACSLFTEALNCDSVDAVNPSVQNHCADYGKVSYDESESPESTVFSHFSELNPDIIDPKGINDFGDWKAYWDSFYSRNYFFNVRTQESTWEPPEGMEHLVYLDYSNESKVMGIDANQMDGICAVSSQNSKTLDSVDLQYIFDSITDDPLLGQSLNENLEVQELTADNFNNSLITSDVRCIAESPHEPYELNQISGKTPNTQQMEIVASALTENAHSFDPCLTHINSPEDRMDAQCCTTHHTRKKKARRERSRRNILADNEELQYQELGEEFSPIIGKYWHQRYQLFSKFDCGIRMDEEGWFSVTPELIAKHHASRCGSGTVVDCFTGVGGNAIQFALRCKHVIAIDIDPKKIEYAQHNAAIYGVQECVDFIRGDSFLLASTLKADTVFLSPPWGGPAYSKVKSFDLKTMLKPYDGDKLFTIAKQIAPRIVMFLPRNVNLNQLAELSLSANPPWSLEVEQNFLNGRLKAITAYFSDPSVVLRSKWPVK
ncbi:uncharacterized protein LOC108223023 isoform X2 [Daucus carota subsp. sativus]|uniref:uncharacterized protein LOC108223023 isoform X2 n=1 Tax=Daucus carota subsp. sativus TaxID=79200 RepID=UPI0007F03646|nr:PREDICTED: uncharacterized protein LOC108223023 isoform X2 [Daucus carota subsp. sativus]